MGTIKSAPNPKIIRVSADGGKEEPVDTFTALRRLRDAYPGFESDKEILDYLTGGGTLRTPFAFYRVDQ